MASVEELRDRVVALEEENALLVKASREDMEVIRNLKATIDTLERRVERAEEEASAAGALRVELASTKERLSLLERRAEKHREVHELNTSLTEENKLLRRQAEADMLSIRSLESSLQDMQLQVQQLARRAEEGEKKAESLASQLSDRVEEVSRLREEDGVLKEQLEQHIEEKGKMEREDWADFWHRKAQRDISMMRSTTAATEGAPSPSSPAPSSAGPSPGEVGKEAAQADEEPAPPPPAPIPTARKGSTTFKTVRQLREERRRQEVQAAAAGTNPPSGESSTKPLEHDEGEKGVAEVEEEGETNEDLDPVAIQRAREEMEAQLRREGASEEPERVAKRPVLTRRIVAIDGQKGAGEGLQYLVRRGGDVAGEWEPSSAVEGTPELAEYLATGHFQADDGSV
eukprot:Sspe_Gene.19405::Locus_7075_Transcript_2_2_Confidence_0.800_Length_1340::g.19405::m.19405